MGEEEEKDSEAGGGAPPPAGGSGDEELDAAAGANGSADASAASADGASAAAASAAGDDGFMSPEEAKLAEANERYLRLMADFDNYRKRVQREMSELAAGAGEDMIRELLPILDNLERALSAFEAGREEGGAPPASAVESMHKGVELTAQQFRAALARQGVERVAAVGEGFDPHRHEALAQEEREGVTSETVVEELEAGYTLRGRVLRPAKVRVARPPAAG
jgi:molecular chaperone GrpE